jgi:transcriptional regulator with XRE-family HTH domain
LGYSIIGFIIWQVKNSIYTSEYQIFLKNLRNARKESGLTQLEVAKKLNQPQSYVSKCESGEKRVDIIELLYFSIVYNKQIDYFVMNIIENRKLI